MPHYYPPHLADFPYVGKLSYALEFTTLDRKPHLRAADAIDLVVAQFRRAAEEQAFTLVTYCLMPDHSHLVVDGQRDDSDCLAFIKAAKQLSGYYYKKKFGAKLWQRYGFERFIRNDMERALWIRYLLANPVKEGLAVHPRDFRGLGSESHTIEELIRISGYTDTYPLD